MSVPFFSTAGNGISARFPNAKVNYMSALFSDTRPEVEQVQIDLLRQAPAWRKLALVGQLNQTARTLAWSGLRQRHPEASPETLRRLFADLLLGPELAARVYGPLPDV